MRLYEPKPQSIAVCYQPTQRNKMNSKLVLFLIAAYVTIMVGSAFAFKVASHGGKTVFAVLTGA